MLLTVHPEHPEPATLARAAQVLRAGGLVAFPTETVYGLGRTHSIRRPSRASFPPRAAPGTTR